MGPFQRLLQAFGLSNFAGDQPAAAESHSGLSAQDEAITSSTTISEVASITATSTTTPIPTSAIRFSFKNYGTSFRLAPVFPYGDTIGVDPLPPSTKTLEEEIFVQLGGGVDVGLLRAASILPLRGVPSLGSLPPLATNVTGFRMMKRLETRVLTIKAIESGVTLILRADQAIIPRLLSTRRAAGGDNVSALLHVLIAATIISSQELQHLEFSFLSDVSKIEARVGERRHLSEATWTTCLVTPWASDSSSESSSIPSPFSALDSVAVSAALAYGLAWCNPNGLLNIEDVAALLPAIKAGKQTSPSTTTQAVAFIPSSPRLAASSLLNIEAVPGPSQEPSWTSSLAVRYPDPLHLPDLAGRGLDMTTLSSIDDGNVLTATGRDVADEAGPANRRLVYSISSPTGLPLALPAVAPEPTACPREQPALARGVSSSEAAHAAEQPEESHDEEHAALVPHDVTAELTSRPLTAASPAGRSEPRSRTAAGRRSSGRRRLSTCASSSSAVGREGLPSAASSGSGRGRRRPRVAACPAVLPGDLIAPPMPSSLRPASPAPSAEAASSGGHREASGSSSSSRRRRNSSVTHESGRPSTPRLAVPTIPGMGDECAVPDARMVARESCERSGAFTSGHGIFGEGSTGTRAPARHEEEGGVARESPERSGAFDSAYDLFGELAPARHEGEAAGLAAVDGAGLIPLAPPGSTGLPLRMEDIWIHGLDHEDANPQQPIMTLEELEGHFDAHTMDGRTFAFEKELGEGGFSGVFLVGPDQGYDRAYALKVTDLVEHVKKNTRTSLATVQDEAVLLARAAAYTRSSPELCPRFVPQHAWTIVGRYVFSLLEVAEGKSLDKYYGEIEDEETILYIIKEVLLQLSLLHIMGYIHADIKPANILVGGNGEIMVADLNCCVDWRKLEDGQVYTGGTRHYQAPEIRGRTHFCREGRGDVYSLFKSVHEIMAPSPSLSREAEMFISSCGRSSVTTRPSLRQALEDGLLQRINSFRAPKAWQVLVKKIITSTKAAPREGEHRLDAPEGWPPAAAVVPPALPPGAELAIPASLLLPSFGPGVAGAGLVGAHGGPVAPMAAVPMDEPAAKDAVGKLLDRMPGGVKKPGLGLGALGPGGTVWGEGAEGAAWPRAC